MESFTAVVGRDSDTGLLMGCVPGFPGAHSQAESLTNCRPTSSRFGFWSLRENVKQPRAELIAAEPRLSAGPRTHSNSPTGKKMI